MIATLQEMTVFRVMWTMKPAFTGVDLQTRLREDDLKEVAVDLLGTLLRRGFLVNWDSYHNCKGEVAPVTLYKLTPEARVALGEFAASYDKLMQDAANLYEVGG